MRRYTITDIMKAKEAMRNAYKQQAELSVEHIEKIKKSSVTEVVRYPKHQQAYDYVDGLFPEAHVKDVAIYKASNRVLSRLGYKGVGGFFNRIAQVVVIPRNLDTKPKKESWDDVRAKVTFDEAMVHELLHYASSCQKKGVGTMEIEEEFAYGNSLGYLRKKGYSDEEIISNNFMPYLFSTIDRRAIVREVLAEKGYDVVSVMRLSPEKQKSLFKKYEKAFFKLTKSNAFEKGLEIIDIYSNDRTPGEVKIDDGSGRFKLLDI